MVNKSGGAQRDLGFWSDRGEGIWISRAAKSKYTVEPSSKATKELAKLMKSSMKVVRW